MTKRLRFTMGATLLAGLVVACGGGGGGSSDTVTCSPKGQDLSISAENFQFSTNCLAVTAGQSSTIAFDNKDAGAAHNVAIYTDSSASKNLFRGDIVTGPKSTTYDVGALDPGTYYFRCDVHPDSMHGTFIVKAGSS